MQDICSLMEDHEAIEAVADQLDSMRAASGGSAEECHVLLCSFERRLMTHRATEALLLQSGPKNGLADAFEVELRALRKIFPSWPTAGHPISSAGRRRP